MSQKSNTDLATEFAEDLFGPFDRLIGSRKDAEEDEGRTGWSRRPVIDNLETLLKEARAVLSEADKVTTTRTGASNFYRCSHCHGVVSTPCR